MSQHAGSASGKTPRWFRGARTRQGALALGLIYLLFSIVGLVLAIAGSGPTRWFWAIAGLGFLSFSLASWTAARRL